MNISNKNPKIICINGLTRSGTNLLSALIAAQENCISNEFAIVELPKIMEFCEWKENRKRIYIDEIKIKKIEKKIDYFVSEFVQFGIKSIYPSINDIKNKYRSFSQEYYGISNHLWIEYLYDFYNCNSINDFTDKYLNFAINNSIKILSTRVTASTPYAMTFLKRNENFFWIEITRDPFARYYSAKRAHSILPEDSFWQSRNQLNIISEIDNERFIKIDYDELTKNPSKILNSIFNKIDVHIDKISNIGVNPNLDTFYGNSSDNKEIFLQDNRRQPVYLSSLKSYKKNISIYDKTVAKIYGFNSDLNILFFLIFSPLFIFNQLMIFFSKIFSAFSILFKYISFILEYFVYFSKKGYYFKASIIRIYSNQKSRLKKWLY